MEGGNNCRQGQSAELLQQDHRKEDRKEGLEYVIQILFNDRTGKRKTRISERGKETRIRKYDACVSGLGLWCMNSRSRKIRRNHERISSPPTLQLPHS